MRHVLMYLRCIGIHQVQMYLRCIGICYHGKLLKQSFRKSCDFVIFRGHLRTRPISPTQNNFSWLNNFFDWKNFEKKTKFFLKSTVFEILAARRFFLDSTRAIYSSGEMGMPRWYIGPQNGILLTSFVTLINFEKKKLFPKVNRFWDIGCSPALLLPSGFHSSHLRFRCNGNA